MTYLKIQGAIILLLFLVDFIWISFSSLKVIYSSYLIFKILGVSLFLYLLYLFYTRIRVDTKIGLLFISTLYLITFTAAALILSYLAYTILNPLMDSALSITDSRLGFSFSYFYYWFSKHQAWDTFFTIIYHSLIYQNIFVFVYFGLFGRSIYLQRFLMMYMISILPTILLGSYYPALGPNITFNLPPPDFLQKAMDYFMGLRHGILDLTQEHGIIIFPSFHTTLGLIYLYTFRHEKIGLFLFFILLNLLMIFSIPIQGGHYLIDIIGGLYIFLITIKIEDAIYVTIKKYGTLDFLPKRNSTTITKGGKLV
ncbi:MAG: hypothetical protein ACD_16C00169G0003 [uncultured bacterium]|nr:MAG: hypothetical protein ACD_16C00169G0003 [uncultured bacterium]OFW68726.1 MAG: hypothetical protein A2X70_03275 [Alphaproteobacteria bacterium GWC2_42_16]OFW73356.1 MAG: hypothetical protein A2Z80_02415 [Alphaproteobacteria bacterium GWA2_41_27]OFW81817.1 MAG: hypothetical protein A3E50_02160 [Alphaproteobacteria bacterium RIFCSPHIGHO2_12_FULL_42_100]OFW85718.1 MAG: hypothetical protein A2W06_04200 [Alphaproteobacteria bacterium RBG_16_42_14]OFW90862.1 MAG: hypothetical protein A3C41_036